MSCNICNAMYSQLIYMSLHLCRYWPCILSVCMLSFTWHTYYIDLHAWPCIHAWIDRWMPSVYVWVCAWVLNALNVSDLHGCLFSQGPCHNERFFPILSNAHKWSPTMSVASGTFSAPPWTIIFATHPGCALSLALLPSHLQMLALCPIRVHVHKTNIF